MDKITKRVLARCIDSFLEKVAAGSLIVALFQGVWCAYLICLVSLFITLKLIKENAHG